MPRPRLLDDNRRNPVVLFYNPFFDRFPKTRGLSCETSVYFTTDQSHLPNADVVVFHVPSLVPLVGVPKYPRNLWAAASFESASNYPLIVDPEFNAKFDLRMYYRRDSDVRVSYLPPPEAIAAVRSAPLPAKTADALAIVMISSSIDLSGRIAYAKELMQHMPIHSYGRLLQNRSIHGPDLGLATKLSLTSRYKFALAFENSIDTDYVTEKFFQPLTVGTVPVYLGAPNVAEYAPGPRSYVDVRDFRDPRELAEYLKYLDTNDEAYSQYFTWRQAPAQSFLDIIHETIIRHPFCRLGELARRRNETIGRPPIGGKPGFPFGGSEPGVRRALRITSQAIRTAGRILLGPAAWN